MSTATNAYWACFVDMGRGTFQHWTSKGGIKFRVESHERQLLKQLQLAYGGTIARSRRPYQRQWSAYTLYAWTITGVQAVEMINSLMPYLRRRDDVAKAWLKSLPNGRPTGHQTVAGPQLLLVQ